MVPCGIGWDLVFSYLSIMLLGGYGVKIEPSVLLSTFFSFTNAFERRGNVQYYIMKLADLIDMNISFRKATQRDSDFAFQIKKTVLEGYVDQIWGWEEEREVLEHTRRFNPENIRVIRYLGEDIGIISIVIDAEYFRVNQIFILPGYQRRGIGSYCMGQLVEEARELGKPVWLRIFKINQPAKAFYIKLGFKQIGETETHVIFEKI